MFRNNPKKESGVSLFLTIIIMTILLAIVLGLSAIFLGQMVMFKEMGHSVIALYAADAGIERVLMERSNPCSLNNTSESLANTAEYILTVSSSPTTANPCLVTTCPAPNYCIKSIGTYQGVSRAIEITY